MDEIYQVQIDGKCCRAGTLPKLVFVEHLDSFIFISIVQFFFKHLNGGCNLYNNCKNIQKRLTLILFQFYRHFPLSLFLHLCPSSLIILTSHLGFVLLPLLFQPNSHKTWEPPSIPLASVTSFVCGASALFLQF